MTKGDEAMIFPARRTRLCVLLIVAAVQAACLNAQPKSLRPDITIKQMGTVGHNAVRIKRDPVCGKFYILQNTGLIQRVNFGTGGTATVVKGVPFTPGSEV